MTVQECDHAVSELCPDLARPEQKALAALVSGIVLAQSAVVSQASAGSPGGAQDRSKQRRAQRLLANPRLDVPRAQRRLLARALAGRRGRLDLLLDATTTGATAQQAGTVSLVLALGWHGRALPLVWRTWTADAPGQDWKGAIRQMGAMIQAALPPEVQVVLLADRGLTGAPLAQLTQELGWHYVWRVQGQTRVCQPDGTVCPISRLAPVPGTQCCLRAVRVWAPRRKGARWISYWAEATSANVVALWRRADQEPWLLVTDLPASPARCADYRRRTWEEELFRDLKSFGWQWQRSRVRRPERVERLLLALALATLWVVCLAQRVLRRGWRPLLEERSRRCYSTFQLGLRWLTRQLATDQPVHCSFHLWAESTAPLKLS
jgi:hypothetical protein